MTEYNAFRVELADKIAHVQINRPDKINAMNQDFWREIIEIFRWVDDTDEVRVVVLSGAGKHFSSGIDLMLLAQVGSQLGKDVGRNADALRRKILELQASFNAVDNCRKPVLAAILRDHRVDDGLEYVATWNAAMLQSADLRVAMAAHMAKQKPEFAD